MHANRLTVLLGSFAVAFGVLAQGAERERNDWPVVVQQTDASGRLTGWNGAGPLVFRSQNADGTTVGGIRPLWVQKTDPQRKSESGWFLYPLFSYQQDETTYRWNVFEMIRSSGRRAGAPAAESRLETQNQFEFWPFWFSRQTGDPELSYRGLFPVAGTVKNKLGIERAHWFAFPLLFESEKRGVVTTNVPWPIVRVTKGAAHGFGIWPAFEIKEQPGRWRRETYLWPLGYNNTTQPAPDAAPGSFPTRDIGALPFYARHTGPGIEDESFVWPFFGYTDRTQPTAYHETRYLWPLLVQGRGDKYVNRWGPFYTHSIAKGVDKTWYAWPVVRHATWTDGNVARERTQFLYVLYWSEEQRSATRPNVPAAKLTHVWPLFSSWNNGAGRRQYQLFSPFEVFFVGNEKVRTVWSPLFAIARHDERPGSSRTSLLWNAVTWSHDEVGNNREFHLGPVFSVTSEADGKRIAIGNGLISFRRGAAGWKTLWLDFPPKPAKAETPAALK